MLVNEFMAASKLGVGVDFLRHDRIGKQLVPFVKIGRSVRYDESALNRFVAANSRGGA